MAGEQYRDKWISCDGEGIRVRWYYLWGTKRIPYAQLRGLERVEMSAARGRARIWGTANPRLWASLDPGRPSKDTAFLLDVGRFVRPFLTPDDPDRFEEVVRAGAGLPPRSGGGRRQGPIV